jgi:hypothetical protein
MTRTREGSTAITDVRGTNNAPVTGPDLWRGNDWEVPPQVPVEYTVTVEDEGDSSLASAVTQMTGAVDYGGDYIAPIGRPELGINVIVEYGGVGGFSSEPLRDVVPVLNRKDPVVVSYSRSGYDGQVAFLTLTDSQKDAFRRTMEFPTVMFVATPDFGFDDPGFFSPGRVTEERTSGLGSEPSRRWYVDLLQVARPPADYGTDLPSNSWQDKFDSADSWQDVLDSFDIWYDFAGFGIT